MDPITLLLLVGLVYAAGQGARAASNGIRDHHRRAGRRGMSTLGWLGGEARHGFPVTRRGFQSGWLAHRQAMDQREHELNAARANHTETRLTYAQARREHMKRIRRAQAEIDRASQPLTLTDPPLADGQTPGQPVPRPSATYPPDGPPPSQPCPACGLKTFHRLDCPRRQRATTTHQPYGAPRPAGNGQDHDQCPYCGCPSEGETHAMP